MVTIDRFGYLPDGQKVLRFTIQNDAGERVELLNYGAMIHAIFTTDRHGRLDDVVLGAPTATELESCSYLGSTIGRCSNRIAHGQFSADGRVFHLEQNLHGHFLHGASDNYARKLFDWRVYSEENTVCFTLQDPGTCGFACTAYAEVEYCFDNASRLIMTTRMVADGTTVLNPTNHAYFDLSCQGDVREHKIQIFAQNYAHRDSQKLPDGGKVSASGSPADFTFPRTLQNAMTEAAHPYFQGKPPRFDEFYILDEEAFSLAAQVEDPASGRMLKLYTDMPCLVLFTAAGRPPYAGKYGRIYEGYCGLCLEPSFVPNAANCPDYKSPVFSKWQPLITKTVYAFSASQV